MRHRFRFHQVDVFSAVPLKGNPLAVVHAAQALSEETMAAFARWTQLSETSFLLPPDDPAADYRVRIFTPGGELPFAGHPTLGSCHAWLAAGGAPKRPDRVVQECGIGCVPIRREGARLAFAAPPLRDPGPLAPAVLDRIAGALGLGPAAFVAHQWLDNGPGWSTVMLASAAQVLALRPDRARLADLKLGVIGPRPPGDYASFEVRAFAPAIGVPEDPVTGSLNAALAAWLIAAGLAPASYVAAQGSALGRDGRVFLEQDADDHRLIWVGGDVADCIDGSVIL